MRKKAYLPKVKRLQKHVIEHPNDYQAVVALLKAKSDEIEHRMYLKRIERLKKLSKVRSEREKPPLN